jgi:hypothetical protein
MVSVVRASKYRHVYGEELKHNFEEVRSSSLASESPLVKCNGKYVSYSCETSGPGILALLSTESEMGRVAVSRPWIRGHTGTISDFAFNPFNEDELVSACDDAHIRFWRVQGDRLTEDLTAPLLMLSGHSKKVNLLDFHPAAAYVLASASQDKSVKVWDVERAQAVTSHAPVSDNVIALQWSPLGKVIGFSTRDKQTRAVDPRANTVGFEFRAHEGSKPSKLTWIDDSTLVTCGFSADFNRQVAVWDLRRAGSALKVINLDQGSGVLYPTYDADTTCLFITGKGDGNVRYYEVVGDSEYMYYLNTYQSTTPSRGTSFLPKHTVDTGACEIMRAAKLTTNSIDFISFRVPRRSEAFQDDIYPECLASEPALSAAQWAEGQNREPVRKPIQIAGKGKVQAEVAHHVAHTQAHSPGHAPAGKKQRTVEELEAELSRAHAEIEALRREVARLSARD